MRETRRMKPSFGFVGEPKMITSFGFGIVILAAFTLNEVKIQV